MRNHPEEAATRGIAGLAAFFNRCAIPCVHHDGGRLARRMRDNPAAGRAPLDGYDRRYAAFTNIDFQTPTDHFDGFRQFDALLGAYGGRCILNTRPVEHWLGSARAFAPRTGRGSAPTTCVRSPGTGAPRGKNTTGGCSRRCRRSRCWCSISNPIRRSGSATSSACRTRCAAPCRAVSGAGSRSGCGAAHERRPAAGLDRHPGARAGTLAPRSSCRACSPRCPWPGPAASGAPPWPGSAGPKPRGGRGAGSRDIVGRRARPRSRAAR